MQVLKRPGSNRLHLIFNNTDFAKGLSIKPDFFGEPGILRLEGLKQKRAGGLGYRGGATEYAITTPNATDFSRVQGTKKWYRKDGGYNWFLVGDRNEATAPGTGLFEILPPSGNLSNIKNIPPTEYDVEAPALWENCDNQIILLLDGMVDRPYSVKLSGSGISISKLGLVAPSEKLSLTVLGLGQGPSIDGVDTPTVGGGVFSSATYKWALSYSYGTREAPELYGESALGPITTYTLVDNLGAGGNTSYRVTLAGITAIVTGNPDRNLITRINVYRTLADGSSFYKIGEITNPSAITYIDTRRSSTVDLSRTPPVLTGLPGPMRVARWINNRLWWFGVDGRLHVSAAGYPDITPANFYVDPGNIGYRGNWIGVIRDNVYVGKEDGIFLISGSVPNLTWKKINNTRCYCRGSFSEVAEGFYFLGENNEDGLAIFVFNGFTTVPISGEIKTLLLGNKPLLYKKAFGKRVHDEYWLAFPSNRIGYDIFSPEYVTSNVPFNNLVLCFKDGNWSTEMIQASSIDVHDGFGDSGEIYFTESDNSPAKVISCATVNGSPFITVPSGGLFQNILIGSLVTGTPFPFGTRVQSINPALGYNQLRLTNNATASVTTNLNFFPDNKAKLLRFDPYARTIPNSYMLAGVRFYNKDFGAVPKIALGPLFGIPNNFDKLKLHKIIVNTRGMGYTSGIIKLYKNPGSEQRIQKTFGAEASSYNFPEASYSNYFPKSSIGGAQCTLGTLVLLAAPLIRQSFSIVDDYDRLSYIIEYAIDNANINDLHYEIEGIDIICEPVVAED